jgi:hypothetical protein
MELANAGHAPARAVKGSPRTSLRALVGGGADEVLLGELLALADPWRQAAGSASPVQQQ